MSQWNPHLVRVGLMGHVGRFSSADATTYPRGTEVVCRTSRGLEVGEVLAHAESASPAEGTVIRRVTVEDRLLLQRLAKNREQAFAACEQLLQQQQLDATLVDVETLFDGSSIYFYFLGDLPSGSEDLIQQLSSAYEAKAQIREFAHAMESGCGPGCGTEAASGCGSSGGCGSCAVAAACGASR